MTAARFTLLTLSIVFCIEFVKGNSAPAFVGTYPDLQSFAEGTATPAGTTLFTVSATDPEGVTPVFNFTYDPTTTSDIVTVTETEPAAGQKSAVITLSTGKELNYETQSTYRIYVGAFDGVLYAEQVLLTLQVTDVAETPTLNPATTVQNFTMTESPTGTTIGHPAFNVSDGDSFEVHTWNITGGTGTDYINIYSTNGTAMLKTNYDLETAGTPTECHVDIEIVDKYGLSVTVTYSLFVSDLNDNLPVFNPTSYTFEVNQTVATGTVLTTVNATDGDVSAPNNEITYSLDSSNAVTEYFNLSSTGDLILKYPIDISYGSGPYEFYAYAADGGSPSYTATATLSITTPTATTVPTTTTDTPPAGYDWSNSSANVALMIVACFVAALLVGYVLVLCWRWHTFGECLPPKCPSSQDCNKCCECCQSREDEERITGGQDDFEPVISPSGKKGLSPFGRSPGSSFPSKF